MNEWMNELNKWPISLSVTSELHNINQSDKVNQPSIIKLVVYVNESISCTWSQSLHKRDAQSETE